MLEVANSWIKRCRTPIQRAKMYGFVAHGRVLDNVHPHFTPVMHVIGQRLYRHHFQMPIRPASVSATDAFFDHLRELDKVLEPWTMMVYHGSSSCVLSAFRREEDAVLARLFLS